MWNYKSPGKLEKQKHRDMIKVIYVPTVSYNNTYITNDYNILLISKKLLYFDENIVSRINWFVLYTFSWIDVVLCGKRI